MALLALGVSTARAAKPEPIDYLRQIKPLLAANCFSCHGALKQQGNLRLDTVASMQKGGDSGSAFVAGRASESLLIHRVAAADASERMPPEGEGAALKPEEIELVKRWIESGAAAPTKEEPEPDPRQHWSFQVPVRPTVPDVRNAGWSANPIDRFVLARMESHGLSPSPAADKRTLLRRVHLDLIGLPPTREEIASFLADDSPNAYERVVERLLDSPQYGERWARHWMDIWRYADWYGRRQVPDVWNSAPQVWRWRDWIVNSLNADKGYERMLQEMLAADELAPGDDQAVVATGYLVRNWYALNPNQWMRDNVEHTAKAFLGLTLACAHCHDHKYDPVTQEEYFRFRAFFEPIGVRQDRIRGEADPGPFQKYQYVTLRKIVTLGRVSIFDENPTAETKMYIKGDERNLFDRPAVKPGVPAALTKSQVTVQPISMPAEVANPALQKWLREAEIAARRTAAEGAKKKVEEADAALQRLAAGSVGAASAELELAWQKANLARLEFAAADTEQKAIAALLVADEARAKDSTSEAARTAALEAESAERLAKLARAEYQAKVREGEVATAKAAVKETDAKTKTALKNAEKQLATAVDTVRKARLALVAPIAATYEPLTPTYPATSTGRRLALARWIGNRDNPLTARVAVNHVWMRHFEQPLVASLYDFGRNGKKPTHPELLDWLAVELMDSNWSLKQLHRLIVTSQTYRQRSASAGDEAKVAVDEPNVWLSRFPSHRLEAEAVRDAVLYTAGILDLTQGGASIPRTSEDTSRRRSMYFEVFPEDGGHLKFLEMFDPPNPLDCYRRTSTIIPQQSLAMTNSTLVHTASRALARRLWDSLAGTADDGRNVEFISAAFEQILGRLPDETEMATCSAFLSRPELTAENTKGADAKGANAKEAAAMERARESLVRALFNHEEFITLR